MLCAVCREVARYIVKQLGTKTVGMFHQPLTVSLGTLRIAHSPQRLTTQEVSLGQVIIVKERLRQQGNTNDGVVLLQRFLSLG